MSEVELLDVDALRRAAEKGATDAQFQLGLCYATGHGVAQNYVEAHKWFNIAAIHGSAAARERRAELAHDMKPDQIAEAQRQARRWISGRAQ